MTDLDRCFERDLPDIAFGVILGVAFLIVLVVFIAWSDGDRNNEKHERKTVP